MKPHRRRPISPTPSPSPSPSHPPSLSVGHLSLSLWEGRALLRVAAPKTVAVWREKPQT